MNRCYWVLLFEFVNLLGSAAESKTAEISLLQADLYAHRYEWHKAFPLYKEAEEQFRRAGDNVRAAYAGIGRIRASVKELSPHQIRTALDKRIKCSHLTPDSSLYLKALFFRADVETDIDALSVGSFDAERRRGDWQEILALSQRYDDTHLQNRSRGELGLLKISEEDPAGFGDVMQTLRRANESGDAMTELRFRTALAALYRNAGRVQDALEHLSRSLELADQEQIPSYFPVYYEKALTLLDEHQPRAALPFMENCAAKACLTGSRLNKAQVLYLRGKLDRKNGNFPKSMDHLMQALEIALESGYQRLISLASMDISRIYRSQGAPTKAMNYNKLGLKAGLHTGDPMDAIIHLHNKGAIQAARGYPAKAEYLYERALRALNAYIAKWTDTSARAFIVSRMSDLFSDYFSLSLTALKDPAKAFLILEQARGRSISDSLRARELGSIPSQSMTGTNPIDPPEKHLARLQAQLWRRLGLQDFRRLLSDVFDQEQYLKHEPGSDLHKIRRGALLTIPLAEVQKALYPDEIILEYVLGDPFSTCLAINRGDIQEIMLPSRKVIEAATAAYRDEIMQGRGGAAASRRLYDFLLAPVAGLDRKQRITIVPDGLLHLLPFEALITPSGRFLISSYMIDYSPSASVTMLLRQRPAMSKGRCKVLIIGDARYSSGDAVGNAFFANAPKPSRLPASRVEVSSIARVMSAVSDMEILLGEDAKEATVKALNLSKFDILHFAVHGTSDIRFPKRSALLFGPGVDQAEDGVFQAWEISRLRLKADLVVLSACDTAVGKLLDQEGVSNLVQAFLLAGARSVVASVWPAEDRSTADLMARFYSYLAQGMDKGSALRHAKLDFIGKYGDNALPIHWAGMPMIGDSSDSILNEQLDTEAAARIPD